MLLISNDIQHGQPIHRKFTCDGESYSPHLAWSDVPEGTAAFVLALHDPHPSHAKGFVHWLVLNIPETVREIRSSVDSDQPIPGTPAWNGTGQPGYIGPCPPTETHDYNFHLYALKQPLNLDGTATYEQVLQAIDGQILAHATLTGTFQRQA
jgi:Raf kinase inhibitor-like YbhB/YbcL family protein